MVRLPEPPKTPMLMLVYLAKPKTFEPVRLKRGLKCNPVAVFVSEIPLPRKVSRAFVRDSTVNVLRCISMRSTCRPWRLKSEPDETELAGNMMTTGAASPRTGLLFETQLAGLLQKRFVLEPVQMCVAARRVVP